MEEWQETFRKQGKPENSGAVYFKDMQRKPYNSTLLKNIFEKQRQNKDFKMYKLKEFRSTPVVKKKMEKKSIHG